MSVIFPIATAICKFFPAIIADSDLGVSTLTRYGTGDMQQNPSYSGVSSYSYSNPTYSGYSRLPQDLGHSGGDQGGSGGRHFTDISSGFGYYDGTYTCYMVLVSISRPLQS